MAAIFQIRRGETNITIADGELYLHKGSGSIQFGSGSGNPVTLLPLNAPVIGDIDLIGNISASGDVRIGGNIYLGNASADNIQALGQFTTNLVPSGTIDVGTPSSYWRYVYATNISASNITANIDGINITTFSTSVDARLDSLEVASASLQSFSSSQLTQNSTLATYTGSVETRLTSLTTYTSSIEGRFTSLGTISGSLISTASNHEIRLDEIESYTSSLKTAIGINGTNVTINGDLIVEGTTTQINSTQVNIGDNILELNFGGTSTAAGIYTKDATGGSTISGSLLWDSTNDYWKAGVKDIESKILLAGGDNVLTSSLQLTEINNSTSSLNSFTASQLTQNTALATITGSLISSASSFENRNASLATISGSLILTASNHEQRITELEAKSASIDVNISNIHIFTSSVNDRFTTLATYTGSIDTKFATLSQVTASIIAATASLYGSASNHEARLDELEYTTSVNLGTGAQVALSAINIATASLNLFTASIGGTNAFTASTNIRLDNLELTTASLNTSVANLNSFTSSINTTIKSQLDANTVLSGSSQISGLSNAQLTNSAITIAGTSVSLGGSITAAKIFEGTNVFSSSAQISSIFEEKASATHTLVSGSSQIDLTTTTNYESGILTRLNVVGVISGSSQISLGSATGNIALATQTTGDYVASLVQGTGVTITNNSGENATPTIAIGQAVGTSANVQFSSIGVGTTASGTAGEIRATGDITAYYSSDIRLKENIIPIPNALEKVNQISGNTYDWKDGYDEVHSHKGNDVGVIAQEIEEILPQIVTNRDTGFKAVQYEKIIPLLIEAIKELSAKVDRLENK